MPEFLLDGIDGTEDGAVLGFEVWCTCGRGLCGSTSVTNGRGMRFITVEPCSDCMASSKKEGVEEGEEGGRDKWREEGKVEGHKEGYKEGYEEGHEEGKSAGYDSGYSDGLIVGVDVDVTQY